MQTDKTKTRAKGRGTDLRALSIDLGVPEYALRLARSHALKITQPVLPPKYRHD